MTALHVKPFRGQVPRLSDRLIGANQASAALNCQITSGRLDPLMGLGLVHTSGLANAIVTMYRYRHNGIDNWLVWPRVVDVVKSPTAQESLGRLYYTGDGDPRMTTYDLAINTAPYPTAFYALGLPAPTAAPALSVTGGTAPVETRSYIYVFRNAFGEESGPSREIVVSGNINGSWDLSGMETAPPNSGTISAAATVATGVVEVTLDTVRGLAQYEEVTFAGVSGMTALNGTFALQSVTPGTSKVTVALDTAQVYSAGSDTWVRVAPHNITGMKKVIKRSIGSEDYKRVAEIPVANTTYSDTILTSALQDDTQQLDSFPPPKNLHSLVTLANGALAGLAGNELCFSEQYKPYSWPLANRYAFAGKGVALCAAENSVIVLTENDPIVFTATTPESASPAGMNTYAPCVAKQSVVDIGGGCLYAGHDGLYLATPAGVKNITNDLYRNEEWSAMVPTSFKATFFDQRYYAMHETLDGSPSKIMVLDLSEPDSIVEIDERADALYMNPLDGKLYLGKANKIYAWNVDDANRYLSYWASREYQLGARTNFNCAQVHANYADIVQINTSILSANIALLADANQINGAVCAAPVNSFAVNGSAIQPVPQLTERKVQFSLRVDGVVVFTKQLNSADPFRLPSGFKSEVQGFSITSSIPVHSVSIAQSEKELGQMSL